MCMTAWLRPEPRPPSSLFPVGRALVASLAGLCVVLAIAGWAIEQRMHAEIRSRALGQLSALADLKVDRIAAWRAERLADAAAIAAPPLGDEGLTRLARGEPPPEVAAWYRQIRDRHRYADVLVVSPGGELLFSASGHRAPLDPPTADTASQALAGDCAVLSDMHRGRDSRIYLDAAAPIPTPGGAAALVLRSDAETLYPLVREWPGSTRTAEALLVRRDGDDALFLSDLRHERGAALAKRISLARTDVVSVLAAKGEVGVREGVDYRGVPVLAELRAVPDSTWWLVAKVDRDEVFETERHLAWAGWAAWGSFLALGGVLAATWVRAERHRRSAAERAALDEAARYRAEVLANVGDGVISTDAAARITSWNRGAQRIFGWTEAEALGRDVRELLQHEYGPVQTRAWTLAELERKGRVELTLRQRRKDGAPIDIETTVVARRDGAGNFLGYIGVHRDVTERKRAEAERERMRQLEADLARASRITTMSELTASLAHEIRQPIAAASANASACARWLAREHPDIGEARAAADRIVASTSRAAEIIDHIRSVYRKGTPARAAVDVNEVARETLTLFQDDAKRHGISLRSELALDLPRVEGDRVQLQQVFVNLMVNAIEAMHGTGGELSVRSERGRNAGELLFSVSDTGVGLPADNADAIFDAFFSTKPQGTGMGLRISRSIVESHGGRLWATTGAPRGATFWFNLPAKGDS